LPNVSVKVDGIMVASVAVLGGVGLLWWNREKIAQGLEDAADKVNPTSDKNIAYEAVNAIGDIVEDGNKDGDFSLGVKIWEWLNPGKVEAGL
jgi:hypothetical protein